MSGIYSIHNSNGDLYLSWELARFHNFSFSDIPAFGNF